MVSSSNKESRSNFLFLTGKNTLVFGPTFKSYFLLDSRKGIQHLSVENTNENKQTQCSKENKQSVPKRTSEVFRQKCHQFENL